MQRVPSTSSRNQYAPVAWLQHTALAGICKRRCDSYQQFGEFLQKPLDSPLPREDFAFVRISRKSEYAIRSLVAMARNQRSWSIQELSAQENIPVKFLEQILLSLRHAGFLSAKRGVGGGYTLRTAPAEISISSVIQTMDGPIAPVACAATQPQDSCTCPDPRTCPLRRLMTDVRIEVAAILDAKSIDDLVKMNPDSALAFEI